MKVFIIIGGFITLYCAIIIWKDCLNKKPSSVTHILWITSLAMFYIYSLVEKYM
jgi:hypothetical protein